MKGIGTPNARPGATPYPPMDAAPPATPRGQPDIYFKKLFFLKFSNFF